MSEFISLVHDGVVAETNDAVLFQFGLELAWIPKSLMNDYSDDEKYVDVAGWFVEQEGLEGYEA